MSDFVVRCPKFYSELDEDIFFLGISKIDLITNVVGRGGDLKFSVDREKMTDQSIRDLLGLFFRYNMEMRPLSELRTISNSHWFYENKNSYWHARVFE